MTYLEKMEREGKYNENMSWCKPFVDKTGEYFLIQHDGEIKSAKTPNGSFHLCHGDFASEQAMQAFALAVNNGYYSYYRGMTDEDIALDAMSETGCLNCPFRHECESVNEEIEEEE